MMTILVVCTKMAKAHTLIHPPLNPISIMKYISKQMITICKNQKIEDFFRWTLPSITSYMCGKKSSDDDSQNIIGIIDQFE